MGKEADGHEKWICCVVMSLINEAGAAGMGDTGTEALRFWYRGVTSLLSGEKRGDELLNPFKVFLR